MSGVATYFKDFLKEIRLTDQQKADLKEAHETLRSRLQKDEELSKIVETTFLQGSYRRATAIRPDGENHVDVDVIVVTNLDPSSVTPDAALEKFRSFLETHYGAEDCRKQGRSWGVTLDTVDLDLVPTAAPSAEVLEVIKSASVNNVFSLDDYNRPENSYKRIAFEQIFAQASLKETWKNEPLLIPDRDADCWDRTHPLEQIRWTIEKNKLCNSHYVNVVKALKWWKRMAMPDAKHPQSYPLEHFVGDCCPDAIESVAQGVVETLEAIRDYHQEKPILQDRGVPEHDVFARLSEDDYDTFYQSVKTAANLARAAFDESDFDRSVASWSELLGEAFPSNEKQESSADRKFTDRKEPSIISTSRFG